jgi:hypothetical protein
LLQQFVQGRSGSHAHAIFGVAIASARRRHRTSCADRLDEAVTGKTRRCLSGAGGDSIRLSSRHWIQGCGGSLASSLMLVIA